LLHRAREAIPSIADMLRRTTFTADRDALATLEAEAKRRGVSLSALVAEAVDEKAQRIRATRSPRVGMGRSSDGRAAAELTADPIADYPTSRS
jgi:hypothetical protein